VACSVISIRRAGRVGHSYCSGFQFLAICVGNRELGGLAHFAALAVPGVIVSRLGERLRAYVNGEVA
jgi:hypothetical protein